MPERTDPTLKRRFLWIVYIAVAVAGLLITQQLRVSRGPERSDKSEIERYIWTDADVGTPEVEAWTDRVDSLARGDDGGGADADRTFLHGSVVDEDLRPVGGALVYAAEPDALFASTGDEWPSLRSAEDGTFSYPVDPQRNSDTIDLLSIAPGLVAGHATVSLAESTSEPVLLVMKRGRSIHGKVTTATGSPVADAFVIAAGPRGGALHVPNGSLPGPRALRGGSIAITARDGSFAIGGLADDETYLVTAQKQGHVIPPGAKQVREVGPGPESREAQFILDPLVGSWIRLVDRKSGFPVTEWQGYWIKKDRTTGRTISPWYSAHNKKAWSGEHPWHPGEFRAVYTDPTLSSGGVSETGVEIWVRKTGFKPTHLKLKAAPVGSWENGEPVVVELDRGPGARFGSLHMRIRNFPRPARPAFIPLSVRQVTTGEQYTFSAQWDADASRYVTRLIPEGSYELLDFVEVDHVSIREGAPCEVLAAFPKEQQSKLEIRLVDDSHRPVSFAAFGLRDESNRSVASNEERYGFRDGTQLIERLPPGRYELAIAKAGFEGHLQQVDLRSGATTELTCTLRRG